MIENGVNVLKEVLCQEKMNETNIIFFTFDEDLNEYDFSRSTEKNTLNIHPLKRIRVILFSFRNNYWKSWTVLRKLAKITPNMAAISSDVLKKFSKKQSQRAVKSSFFKVTKW